ncbi:hypothetical protein QIS74_01602 [Colletotrichum tabaci]|uniref:Uncharacterized protein n=1 Tax=Colletotrichum tabaci TaxID=1209068 RepID=A0AAV9TR49_9PEZI
MCSTSSTSTRTSTAIALKRTSINERTATGSASPVTASTAHSYFGGGKWCGGQLFPCAHLLLRAGRGVLVSACAPGQFLYEPSGRHSVNTDFTRETDSHSGSQQNPRGIAFKSVMLVLPEELHVSLDNPDGSHWDVCSGRDTAIGEEGPQKGTDGLHEIL